MDHRRVLDLDTALAIASAALSVRRDRGYRSLTVAVLDPGGHVVVLQREDGSCIFRPQIAVGKARGALGMGFGTRELPVWCAEGETEVLGDERRQPRCLGTGRGALASRDRFHLP